MLFSFFSEVDAAHSVLRGFNITCLEWLFYPESRSNMIFHPATFTGLSFEGISFRSYQENHRWSYKDLMPYSFEWKKMKFCSKERKKSALGPDLSGEFLFDLFPAVLLMCACYVYSLQIWVSWLLAHLSNCCFHVGHWICHWDLFISYTKKSVLTVSLFQEKCKHHYQIF